MNPEQFWQYLRGLSSEQRTAYARARLNILERVYQNGIPVDLPDEEERHHMAMRSIGLEPIE